MRSNRKFAFVASTALTLVTPAFGQEAADGNAGDIVVTARRVEERLKDVPISMTVFNQDQVAARNIVSGNDLATPPRYRPIRASAPRPPPTPSAASPRRTSPRHRSEPNSPT